MYTERVNNERANTSAMAAAPSGRNHANPRPRVLFICGSLNQTTQMERIARELPEIHPTFAPYYLDGLGLVAKKLGLAEATIGGHKHENRCVAHLRHHGHEVDMRGNRYDYDAVLLSTDQRYPYNIRKKRVILVQEGILDPPTIFFPLIARFPQLPRWWAGTAATGLSKRYEKFCVASDGYRDYFSQLGCETRTLEVTGIPNFDDCASYYQNTFPYRGYVLVCTSDARETGKRDDRPAFLRRAVATARGRQLIFKLHPNENMERAAREIRSLAPDGLIFTSGSAEEMVANASVLICQYSSLAFVGIALGKEVHSYFSNEELTRLLPIQNRSAARNIADVVRRVLGTSHA